MSRRILAIIIAIVLAVGGAALVLVYAQNADKRAIADAQPSTVWVAEKLIPAGTTLKDAERTALIAKTQVAAVAVPQGALPDVNADNNALLALSDIQPGEYLLSARFGSTPVGTKAIEVPSGKVAVSVELSDPARVGSFVTPGSHIAIYQTYKLVKLGTDEASKQFNDLDFHGTNILLDDVLVIGMGDTPLNAPGQSTGSNGTAEAQDSSKDSQGAELPRHGRRHAGAVGQAGARRQHLHALRRSAWVGRQVPRTPSSRRRGDAMTILWDADTLSSDRYRYALSGDVVQLPDRGAGEPSARRGPPTDLGRHRSRGPARGCLRAR